MYNAYNFCNNLLFYIVGYKIIYTFQNFKRLTKNIVSIHFWIATYSLKISGLDYLRVIFLLNDFLNKI